MLLVSILSAIAIPAFLDLRRDAKVAALRSNLNAIRGGIRNQTQQALLKCGARMTVDGLITASGLINRMFTAILYNNITLSNLMCSPAQVPNIADRRFFDLIGTKDARYFISGVEQTDFWDIPENPFTTRTNFASSLAGFSYPKSSVDSYGGTCGLISFLQSLDLEIHWLFIWDVNEMYPGTNTAGVNECNF